MNVVPDAEVQNAKRLLLCTGKIGHELRVERQKRGTEHTAIVFIDQLYPWPEAELEAEFERHPESTEIVWVQEEPANMGALSFVMPRLRLDRGFASGAEREAFGSGEPGDRFGEGSRTRAGNADRYGSGAKGRLSLALDSHRSCRRTTFRSCSQVVAVAARPICSEVFGVNCG